MTLPLPPVNDWSDLQFALDRIAQQFPIGANNLASGGTVTALPGSPSNGQEVNYLADATNGVVWTLKYRSGSGSAFKWEFVGGTGLASEVATDQANAGSTTYVDLATVGPQVTVPLAGDYVAQWGNETFSNSAVYSFMALKRGAAATANADSIQVYPSVAATQTLAPARRLLLTGLTASTVIKAQYRAGAAVTVNHRKRWLELIPVRVG